MHTEDKSSRISREYGDATAMIQITASELYESLHDDDGNPILDPQIVREQLDKFMTSVRVELDGIRNALQG